MILARGTAWSGEDTMRPRHRGPRQRDGERGFTLIELVMVVAIIAILTAIAVPLYADFLARSRIAQAQADSRTLASAVSAYSAHMGATPPALSSLTATATNPQGQSAGPFMAGLPTPPLGWAAYAYTSSTAGTFSISTSGDSTTVTVP